MKSLIKHNNSQNYIQNLQDEMTRLMEDVFGGTDLLEVSDKKMWRPALEMSETDKTYEVKFQLPGFDRKDIDIEVGDNFISIKAENMKEKEERKKNLYKSEFRYGNFLRTVSFPSNITPEKAHAEFQNGVLTISAEKAKVKENVRKIKVTE